MKQWSIKKRLGLLTFLLTLEMLVLGLANEEINRRLSAGLSDNLEIPTNPPGYQPKIGKLLKSSFHRSKSRSVL
jgi:hypothetical protein